MTSKNIYNSLILWFKYLYKIVWLKLYQFLFNNDCKKSKKLYKKDQADINLIPEVKGLPLVGTLFDLITAGGAPK